MNSRQLGQRTIAGVPLAVIVGVAVLAFSASARADDAALRRRFQNEYSAAVLKVREVYSHLTLKATWSLPPGSSGSPLVVDVDWAAAGEKLRVVRKPIESHKDENRDYAVAAASVASPRLSFRLEPATEADAPYPWTIENLSTRESRLASILLAFRGPFAPFMIYDETVLGQMEGIKGFRIVSFDWITENGERLAKMQFQYPGPEVSNLTWSGWYLFAPDSSWVLHGYRYGAWEGTASEDSPPVARQCAIRYRGWHDGVPLLEEVQYWIDDETATDRKELETWSFRDVRITDVPDREFTLAAFGLPDDAEAVDPTNRAWMLFAGGAILFLAGCGVSLWRARRRRRGS